MGDGSGSLYDYHVMVLAPGLESAWFFQAARQFWQTYHPIVTDQIDVLRLLPRDASVGVTLLARTDSAPDVQAQIEAAHPGVTLDLIVMDDLPLMELILNSRAESGAPFG